MHIKLKIYIVIKHINIKDNVGHTIKKFYDQSNVLEGGKITSMTNCSAQDSTHRNKVYMELNK